ncbi:MAG: hypothetical protein JWM82_4400 [Myxococcales bacterium]|nr:hypothetical protein [Myxococcales bacterium]
MARGSSLTPAFAGPRFRTGGSARARRRPVSIATERKHLPPHCFCEIFPGVRDRDGVVGSRAGRAARGSVCGLAILAGALVAPAVGAQTADTPGAPKANATPKVDATPKTDATLEADASSKPDATPPMTEEQAMQEEANVARLQGIYNLARTVVGGQHVVLAPVVFGGRRCASGNNIFGCMTPESHGGIAGIVLIPIVGFGGGHGIDLWPRIHTDDVADGFYQFDKQFRRMRDQLTSPLGLADGSKPSNAVLEQRYKTLASALDDALARMSHQESHSTYHEDMEKMRACLDTLTSAPLLSQPVKPPVPAQSCQAGMDHVGVAAGWTRQQKLDNLNELWEEYDRLVDAQPLARHNFLIGPIAGVSITDKLGDLLYGGGFEVGWKQGFRLTAAAGLRSSMTGSHAYLANMDRVGWWAGVGLSGQLGDQLMNGILGVNRIFSSGISGTP